ncbi:MAG: glycosyltransferase family 2 protein [Planctomycetota bacterium]
MSGSAPVSVVIASLDDVELFERHLPPLFRELDRRGVDDEVVVVDDTGRDVLSAWFEAHFAAEWESGRLRCVVREANGGFAAAMLDGGQAARHELLFAMNPDILVHEGFLDPLVEALADTTVHSSVPKILLFGDPDRIESLVEIDHDRDVAYIRQRALDGEAHRLGPRPAPVNYAIGGGMLVRRDDFVRQGGFDRLYDPFYYEDVDLGFEAWRAGREVRYVPESVVEHHHRGTIKRHVDAPLVRAVIERNRYLFQWRFLDGQERVEKHVAALQREIVDAHLRDEREELVWLILALDRIEELKAARARLGPAQRSYDEVCDQSRPDPDAPRLR